MHNPIIKTIEASLFSWKAWDEEAIGVMKFYNCTFKSQVGKFTMGRNVALIYMDFQNSTMTVYENQQPDTIAMAFTIFNLALRVSITESK